MKKGLAVIYDPHNLYQFIWYYCNKGKKAEWDALCLPNAQKGEYMHTYCEKTGVFNNVFRDNTGYETASAVKKASVFLSMVFHFIIGRRKAFCRKLLNRFVPLDDYDEIVVIAGVGIISGACIALGNEKNVIILEDGINDYKNQPRMIPLSRINSLYNWQGCILAAMGYCNPGWYRLNTTRSCIKYSSQPEKMVYRNYRELRQLYTNEGTDLALFDELSKRIYPKLHQIDFERADAVLLTRPLSDYVQDAASYKERIEEYVGKHYRNIIIKKHPREDGEYRFPDGVVCVEIDNSIPAEAMLPYLEGKDILIMSTSAISLYMKAFGLRCKTLMLKGLYEDSVSSGAHFLPMTEQEARDYCERFAEGCYEMVSL